MVSVKMEDNGQGNGTAKCVENGMNGMNIVYEEIIEWRVRMQVMAWNVIQIS